jgi:polyketide cyclase/dehydrase/lipid transport protein
MRVGENREELKAMSLLAHHYETSAFVRAPADKVFAHVDDQSRLSSHMTQSSWMMGGGRMDIELDNARGESVGSRIRLTATVFGIRLSVEEVVIERHPPDRKVWETIGSPRLLVIGRYRMGFEITPREGGSLFRVFIDYAPPEGAPARWLGYGLGRFYARWCTQQMVNDAVGHFAAPA